MLQWVRESCMWNGTTKITKEIVLQKNLKNNFPSIEAVVGGETGIDIYPVGADKGQILRDFPRFVPFFFEIEWIMTAMIILKKALEKRKGPYNCYP